MNGRPPSEWIAGASLGVLLIWLAALTTRPFLNPLAWAVIIGYSTHPLYGPLRRRVPGRNLPALLMTVVVGAGIALPATWLLLVLKDEFVAAMSDFEVGPVAEAARALVDLLRHLPLMGERLADALAQLLADPAQLLAPLGNWLKGQGGAIASLAGAVGRDLLEIGIFFFTLFFLYRDGDAWARSLRRALGRVLGSNSSRYIETARVTTRAVVYGMLATAIGQGLASGLGYWMAGVRAPTLLGALTAAAAVLPYGGGLVWGPVCIWIAVSGEPWTALGLAAWGAIVVGSVDNLVRPIVISHATRVHLLVTALGVIGGAIAFGVVGIFIGPVVLSLLLVAWQLWIERGAEPPRADDSAQDD